MTSNAIVTDRKRAHRNNRHQRNRVKTSRIEKVKSASHKLLHDLLRMTGVEK